MIRSGVPAVIRVLTLATSIGAILHAQADATTQSAVPQDNQDAAASSHGPAVRGILVLDNCDPEFTGKATFDDNLTYFGALVFRATGFNNSAEKET